MKKLILKITVVLALAVGVAGCKKDNRKPIVDICAPELSSHPKAAQVQEIIKRYTDQWFPGAMVAFKDANGYWQGAAGYSKSENKTPMKACQLAYGHSITKFYTANIIMKLNEEGKINLDAPIANYLSANELSKIPHQGITVRMLLNHSSGLQDYTQQTAFQTDQKNNLFNPSWYASFTAERFLSYIEGKDLLFEPGTDAQYSNCNYLLLARIIEGVTGKTYPQVIQEKIFQPLGLRQSYYPRDLSGYDLPDSYLDLKSFQGLTGPLQFENVTASQKSFTQVTLGDDGIIATPHDFVSFMEAFARGQVVSQSSSEQMLTFMPRPSGFSYGLGVENYAPYGLDAYGHSGSWIGAACNLFYIPETGTSVFIFVNCGVDYSPTLSAKYLEMMTEILTMFK